jgi:hypothetical protein
MNARYLSCAETAKLVRAALKAEFPGQKFSVRSSTYSGGASISVNWTDGPTTKEVDKILHRYEGKSFDASIDMGCYWQHWMMPDGTATIASGTGTEGSLGYIPKIDTEKPDGAELVSMGANYVQSSRSFSAEFLRPIAERVAKREGAPVPEIRTYPSSGNAYAHCPGSDLDTWIWREAETVSAYQKKPATITASISDHQKPDTIPTPATESASISDYKGHPILELDTGNGKPFRFGLSKAMAILANLDAVARFVQTDGQAIS